MVLANIEDSLGNQMFAYAATKSIALDLGFAYRYRVVRPSYAGRRMQRDAFGHEWAADFERHFAIDGSERCAAVPREVAQTWHEPWPRDSNFQESVYRIKDNTILDGHFCSPKYFQHRRAEVLGWFSFAPELKSRSERHAADCRRRRNLPLAAVHVRFGADYAQQNKAISLDYYHQAIQALRAEVGPVHLLLFSDVLNVVEPILRVSDPELTAVRGTMFEDLCLMTLCDHHIIGNSTFSWWGAWLAQNGCGLVVRPSVYPIQNGLYYPLDIYPENWRSGTAIRAPASGAGKPGWGRQLIRYLLRRGRAYR